MADKLDLIIDKIDNVHNDFKEYKAESNARFDEYNSQLAEHIEGVQQNRTGIAENRVAIEVVKKEPIMKRLLAEAANNSKKIAMWITSVGGAAYIILRLLGKL